MADRKKRIVVVAGNYRQYLNHLASNGILRTDSIYANTPTALLGLRAKDIRHIVKVGTWYENTKDLDVERLRMLEHDLEEAPKHESGGA